MPRPRWLSALLALAVGACSSPPPAPHTPVTGSLEPLRGVFNNDSGKVRAIFLASPT